MEKLAVDLEKVLDDFEKEQLHNVSSSRAVISNKYSAYDVFHEHPTRNFGLTPFEQLNLPETDFPVHDPPILVHSQPNFPSTFNHSNNDYFEQSTISNDSFVFDDHSERKSPFRNKDFKPDLIETNNDICNHLKEFDRVERHLPDIASTDVVIKEDKSTIDLITTSNFIPSSSESKEKTGEAIKFPVSSDISDHELHKYLETLENEAEKNKEDENTKSNVTAGDLRSMPSCDNQNRILINVPSASSKEYVEKSKINVQDDSRLVSNTNEVVSTVERTTLSLNTTTGSVTTLEVVTDEATRNDKDRTEMSNLESTTTSEMSYIGLPNEASAETICVQSKTDNLCHEASDTVSLSSNSDATTRSMDDETDSGQVTESISYDLEPNNERVEFDEEHKKKRDINDTVLSTNDYEDNETEILLSDSETCSNTSINFKETSHSTDNIVSTSESCYQVLDSRTAISTFESESEDHSSCPNTSTNCECDEENLKNEDATTENTSDQMKIQRPDSLNLSHTIQTSEMSSTSADSGSLLSIEERKLGKEPPFWIPDSETQVCMHCQLKFTLVRRRHHCRACGLVLCSKCCDLKASLEYLRFEEARVCRSCHGILERVNSLETEVSSMKRPNPNNPMEYCSTIPPPLQVGPNQPYPPTVMVPVVGVLKREGRAKSNDPPKQVIFSDGIRPGGDLTELDAPVEPRLPMRRRIRRVGTPPGTLMAFRRMLNVETRSFIPSTQHLPPLVTKNHGDYVFSELEKPLEVEDDVVKFAINCNLFILAKRVILDCCVNRDVWCMTTEGLSCVGQDEIVFLLEVMPDEKHPPKDVFCMVNMLYQEAAKGSTVTEMSFAAPYMNNLFDSKEHGGFVFIRPTYQCVQKLLLPNPPFLIALLIHRWETPWARLFPIRLVLRLGAEYRYYPCPLVSIRNRPALFTDIGHTIIGLLADFRKYSYSLPTVRGLMIHMEDRMTTILLPKNRYDQVLRAMNNSGENVLAFAGNISTSADSHLVCIQSMLDDLTYTTQAINIHNKPRKITGASFVVFNGSLKQYGWTGKSNIVEDGLMVQIPSESMTNLRNALRQMQDYSIGCGPQSEEMVVLKWAPDDVNFNIGVRSLIDNKPLDGIPSIRVHNGTDYSGVTRLIRWTEVFIIQSDDDSRSKTGDTVNISKLSESIARATCMALVPLLDLLTTANLTTLAIRANIDPENVGYEAGTNGERLPPLYMKSLDNEVITVVNEAALSIREISRAIVLELVFKVMEQGTV